MCQVLFSVCVDINEYMSIVLCVLIVSAALINVN